MGGRRRDARANGWIAAVASAIIGFALAAASPAMAATTLGQTSASSPGDCTAGAWRLEDTTGTAAPGYAAPPDSVITSWSTYAAAGAGQQMQLKLFRLTDAAFHYLVVGESAIESLTPSSANTFSTRIPVGAGDLLGSYQPSTSSDIACEFMTSDNADHFVGGPDDATPGSTVAALGGGNEFRLNESAVLEPDADGDGYGDETQDTCPLDPTTHTDPCQADLSLTEVASAPAVTLGDTVSFTITVKNDSAYIVAKAVSVSAPLSSGLALVSATGGSCSLGTCAVGDLAPGGSAIVTVIARGTGVGAQAQAASVASQTPDLNTANNSAVMAVTVVQPSTGPPNNSAVPPVAVPSGGPAPFSGLKLRSQTIKVGKSGKVKITATCAATAVGNCVGTDTLTSAGKVRLRRIGAKRKTKTLRLGKATFSLPAGQTRKITIKLSKSALKLLAKEHRVKAVQRAVSHDSRNTPKTTTGRITLTK